MKSMKGHEGKRKEQVNFYVFNFMLFMSFMV